MDLQSDHVELFGLHHEQTRKLGAVRPLRIVCVHCGMRSQGPLVVACQHCNLIACVECIADACKASHKRAPVPASQEDIQH